MQALWRSIAGAISSEQLGWELGWTMLYFVAAGAALWGLAALLRRAMRPCSPHARYVAALACLVTLAVLAPASFFAVRTYPEALMLLRPQLKAAAPYGATGDAVGIDSPFRGSAGEWLSRRSPGDRLATAWSEFRSALMDEKLAPILSAILPRLPWLWLVGTSLMLIYFSLGLMGADRLRRECDSLEQDELGGLLHRLRREMGVSRRVLLGMSDRVAAPLVVGVMRPMILLPMSVVSSLSVDQLEFVLLHELAHVRRHDNLINLFQRFVEAIAFFHPAAWRISAWVRLEREHCCDAAVLSRRSSRSAYAETLASLAMPGISAPYAVASLANHQLVSRVRHIMQAKEPSMRFSSRWFVATAMALLATGGFVAALAQTPDKPEPTKPEEKSGAGDMITIEVQLDEAGVLQLRAAPDASYASVAELLKSLAGTLDKEGKHPKIKVKANAHGQKWSDWTTANCSNCHQAAPQKSGDGQFGGVEFKLNETCEPGVVEWLKVAAAPQQVVDLQPKALDASVTFDAVARDVLLGEQLKATVDFVQEVKPDNAAIAWSVKQATGAPDTFVLGDQSTAWASKSPDGQGEWLVLTYEQPVEVGAVLIHETFNPGAVARVDAILPTEEVIVLWSGEPAAVKTDTPRLFLCKPKKSVKTAKIRVTIASDVVSGWNEIDAVGILDSDGKVHWAKDASASTAYGDASSARLDLAPAVAELRLPDVVESRTVLDRFQGILVDDAKMARKAAPIQEVRGAINLLLDANRKKDADAQAALQFLGLKAAVPDNPSASQSEADKLKQIEAELEALQKQLETLRAKMRAR